MKIKLIFLFVLFAGIATGQPADSVQVRNAEKFLNQLINGQTDSCWLLFDKTNNPGLTRVKFDRVLAEIWNDLAAFDSFELTTAGIKFAGDQQLNMYTYKAISSGKNVVDEISVDILFLASSPYVAGIQPKKKIKENAASTTRGKETQVAPRFSATIDNVQYNIRGINIVHFANNEAILAIQVEYSLPDDKTETMALVKKEAVKFARYLVKNGYWEKAKQKADEIGRKLLEDIGISFLDPVKGNGYNELVKAEEYK